MAFALAAAAFLSLPFLTSAAHAGGLRKFGTWVVGCDNTRHCRAIAAATTLDPDAPTWLVIDREPGPAGRLRIGGGGAFAPDKVVRVDGKAVLMLAPDVFFDEQGGLPDTDPSEPSPLVFVILKADAQAKILAAALGGGALTFDDNAGPQRTIVLDGLSSALRFMDAEQGRSGTVTALVAKGDRPAESVPPAEQAPHAIRLMPPLPKKEADRADIEAVNRFHRQNVGRGVCEEKWLGATIIVEPVRVSERQAIYDLVCRDGGSMFVKRLYLIEAGSPPAKVAIERPDPATGELRVDEDFLFTGIGVDDGNWVHLREGDKTGDCREAIVWRWNGKILRIVSSLLLPFCGADPSTMPAIVLWRTREP